MIDYEEDYAYAQDKILDTIVRLIDGTPVIIFGVYGNQKKCEVRTINKKPVFSFVKLKELDLSSPPLGFLNYNFEALYASRFTKRRDWKQGLRDNNTFIAGGYNLRNFIDGGVLNDCILGKYPKLQSIFKRFDRKVGRNSDSMAWHRHWAIRRDGGVLYKTWGVVGLYSRDNNDIVFNDHMAYLRESFEESRK